MTQEENEMSAPMLGSVLPACGLVAVVDGVHLAIDCFIVDYDMRLTPARIDEATSRLVCIEGAAIIRVSRLIAEAFREAQ